MTETANQLLATFDSLPTREQHEVMAVLLRRSGELPDSFLTDDELVSIADELFLTLDAEEANGQTTEAE